MTTSDRAELPPLRPRPAEGHKGTFGRVLVAAGSFGMSGAAALSGLGALRGGAGLVSLAVPRGIVSTVASIEPSYLTIPLPEDEQGRIAAEAVTTIESQASKMSVVAIGPGWGRSNGLTQLAEQLYANVPLPMVIDADALNALAERKTWSTHAGPRILTPHPGEFARMTDSSIEGVQQQRDESALRFAAEHDVVIVLKGHRTVVTDGTRLHHNTTGNSGMATGGTGDVLTGLLSALLAQGYEPFEAAQLGAWLHGRAGDLASGVHSEPGMIASDVASSLGAAWRSLIEQA